MHQQVFPNRERYMYAKRLLREREEELRALKERRECELIDFDDYSSCRRSLLRAINELEQIVATGGQVKIDSPPGTSTVSCSDVVTKSNM